MTTKIEEAEAQPKIRTCFVIGPIGDHLAEEDSPAQKVYEDALETFDKVIKPACRKNDIVPLRADEINEAGEITEQICRNLIESDLVIADLSGGNPNVAYELGIRHAIGKLTLHIAEYGKLPFDIAGIRTVRFARNESGLIKARKDLTQKVQQGLDGAFRPLTPARIILGLPVGTEDHTPEHQPEEDADPLGFMDGMAEVETHFDSALAPMDGISKSLESLTQVAEDSIAPMMDKANADGVSVAERQKVIIRSAELLRPIAQQFKQYASEVWHHIEQADQGMTVVFDYVESTPVEQRAPEHMVFLEQITAMAATSRDSIASFQGMAPALVGMPMISRSLRGPVSDLTSGIKLLVDAGARIEAWDRRAGALLGIGPLSPVADEPTAEAQEQTDPPMAS